jgi:hypothetical protein
MYDLGVLLLTNRRIKVLVQAMDGIKLPMTEVAFPGEAVPRVVRSLISARPIPSDQLLRDPTLRILGSDELVQLIAVDVLCVGAGSLLDMMGDAGSSSESLAAEGTRYVRPTMSARVQVLEEVNPAACIQYSRVAHLLDIVEADERPVAILAVVVEIDLVCPLPLAGVEPLDADVALVLLLAQ